MGRELNISPDKIQEFVEDLNETTTLIHNALNNLDINRKDENGNTFDQRDLFDIAISLELKGKTVEERQIEMNEKVTQLYDEASSSDPVKRKAFFDRTFDLLDSSKEYLDKKIDNFNDFKKLVAISSINQAIATKRNENKELYLKRYNTQEKRDKKIIDMASNYYLSELIEDFIENKANKLDIRAGFNTRLAAQYNLDYYSNFAESKIEGNNIVYKLPTKIVEQTKKVNKDEPTGMALNTLFADLDTQVSLGKYCNDNSVVTSITTKSKEFTFIGDKSLDTLAKEELERLNINPKGHDYAKQYNAIADHLFRKGLLSGEKPITIAIPQYLDNDYSIKLYKIKPDVENLSLDLMKEDKVDEAALIPTKEKIDEVYKENKDLDKWIIQKAEKSLVKLRIEENKFSNCKFGKIKFKSDDVVLKGTEHHKKMEDMIIVAMRNLNTEPGKNYGFDARDLQKMAELFDLSGDNDEQKQQDLNNKYKQMFEAFCSGDPVRKKPYLDMLFSKYEETERLLKYGVNTPYDMHLALATAGLQQTIGVKEKENQQYMANRYSNVYDNRMYRAITMIHASMDEQIKSKVSLVKNGQDTTVHNFLRDMFDCFAAANLEAVSKNKKDVSLNIPVEFLNRDLNYDKDVFNALSAMTYNLSHTEEAINSKEGAEVLDTCDHNKTIYIDGINIEALAANNMRKTDKYRDPATKIDPMDIRDQSAIILKNAIMKGNKVISYIEPLCSKDGTLFRVKNIKPDLSAIREHERSKYTWFRKTFFDWGPFKIDCPPPQKDIDELYAKSKYQDTIMQDFTQKISDSVALKKSNEVVPKNDIDLQKALQTNETVISTSKTVDSNNELNKSNPNIKID